MLYNLHPFSLTSQIRMHDIILYEGSVCIFSTIINGACGPLLDAIKTRGLTKMHNIYDNHKLYPRPRS